jgi:hypothetical protein
LGVSLLLAIAVSYSGAVQSATSAGTVVSNAATANYTIGVTPGVATAAVDFTVLEVIDVAVSWDDGANIFVSSPDSDQVATFTVVNTGNGTEAFTLSVANVASPADDFDFDPISNVEIYLDTNGNGVFEPGTADDLYIPSTNDPMIPQNGSQLLFVVADVPASQPDLAEGHLQLTATSTNVTVGGQPAGTVLAAAGDGGVDAVVGSTLGDGEATAIFQVSSVVVTLTTEVDLVVDPYGTATFVPTAEVTYLDTLIVSGGTAILLTASNPIPANTTFKPGSITLNGVSLTDQSDGDAGRFDSAANGSIEIVLGDTIGGTTNEIRFTVIID